MGLVWLGHDPKIPPEPPKLGISKAFSHPTRPGWKIADSRRFSPICRSQAFLPDSPPAPGPCPAPLLSVEPPSGAVAAGQRLRLTCAAPWRRFRRRFRFFRDGAEVAPGADDVIGDVTEEGAELLFPQISPELAGNFSCRVEEEVGGAWLEAPPSQGVAVVVRGRWRILGGKAADLGKGGRGMGGEGRRHLGIHWAWPCCWPRPHMWPRSGQ